MQTGVQVPPQSLEKKCFAQSLAKQSLTLKILDILLAKLTV